MKIVQLQQGSPEWHAHRARYFNASDAPAVLGCSPYKTRAQLLREVHTGLAADVDAGTQRIFDAGHRFEALARPLAEQIVGDDLYPCVGVEGKYSASFDGLTLGGETALEHKTLSAGLQDVFDFNDPADAGQRLPKHYRAQMEHQCMVSGAERVLFMATKWADDDTLIDSRHCWYTPDAELRAEVIAGWQQFAADLAAYVPPAIAEPARAEPMESLPAVAVRLDGALTVAGNLPTFAQALRAFIDRMPKQPATDNDFATVDAGCKALKRAEAGALASITHVEAMRRAVADCRKLARDTRLAAEKLVERRKIEIKEHAVRAAGQALIAHVAALNAELAPMALRPVAADFPGAIKGLRSISSMQDALDTALAAGKIAADQQARAIRANVAAFKAATGDDRALQALFADLGQLVHKAGDDFAAVLDQRITKHRTDEAAREAQRQAAEAQRIAAAEQRAREQAEREAAQRLADARAKIAQAEADRVLTEQRAESARLEALAASNRAALAAATPAPAHAPAPQQYTPPPFGGFDPKFAPGSNPNNPQTEPPEPATLSLGAICGRLGFTVSGDFLRDTLRIAPARTDKRAMLYTESQFQTICSQLRSHISAMAELYTADTVD